MWQRGIGGSSTPTVETISYTGGLTKTFALTNGMFCCKANNSQTTYSAVGYVINGVLTSVSTGAASSGTSMTYNASTHTVSVTLGSAVAAGTMYIYRVD